MHTLNDTLNLDHVDTSEAEQLYPITDHIYINKATSAVSINITNDEINKSLSMMSI